MEIIGMIHLKALPGYPQHSSMSEVIAKAVTEAGILQEGGVDAIMIENTDDDPHQKEVGPETIAAFSLIAAKVMEKINIPLGICVLWNDFRASLAVAKISEAQFVRVPVFTEAALTASGIIEGNPYGVISYREKIKAGNIKIMADVQVKHAARLGVRPITESATEAIHFGADEIIVTGRYTGDQPNLEELEKIRLACPNACIVIGSGTTPKNFHHLAKYANKAIVGTCFKPLGSLDLEKIKELVSIGKATR